MNISDSLNTEKRLSFLKSYKRRDLNADWRLRYYLSEIIEPTLSDFNFYDKEEHCYVKSVKEFVSTEKTLIGIDVRYMAHWNRHKRISKHAGYWWCDKTDYQNWLDGVTDELKFLKVTTRLQLSAAPEFKGELNCLYIPQTKLVTMPCFYEPNAEDCSKTRFVDYRKTRYGKFTKHDSASMLVLCVLESMFLELELAGKLKKSASFYVSVETLFKNVYGAEAVAKLGKGAALRNRQKDFVKSMDILLRLWNFRTEWSLAGKDQKAVEYLKSQEIKSASGQVKGWVFDISNSPWHRLAEHFCSHFMIDLDLLKPFTGFNDRVSAFTACYLFEYQNQMAMMELRKKIKYDKAIDKLTTLITLYEHENKVSLYNGSWKDLSYESIYRRLRYFPYFKDALDLCYQYRPLKSDYFLRKRSNFELVHSRLEVAMRSDERGYCTTWKNLDGRAINRFAVKTSVLDTLFKMFEERQKVGLWGKLPCGSYEYIPVCENGILSALGVDFPASVTWKPGRDINGKKLKKYRKKYGNVSKTVKILSPISELPQSVTDIINSDDIMAEVLKWEIATAKNNFDKLPDEIKERILYNETLNKNNRKYQMWLKNESISSHVEMKLRAFDPNRICESVSTATFGRLYSHGKNGFQGLSGKERLNLLINDKPVSEVDFKCLHCTLVEAVYNNIQAPQDVYSQVKWTGSRNQVKTAVNVAINACDNEQAAYSISKSLKINFKTAKDLIKAIENGLPGCKNKFFSDAGVELQWIDSGIILKACTELQKSGYPALPVHDSILTTAEGQMKAAAIMEDIYMKVTNGFKIGLSTKSIQNGKIVKNEILQKEAADLIKQEILRDD